MADVTPQAIKDYYAKLGAHLDRADATLTYLDGAFDKAVALIDNPPTGAANQFAFGQNVCVVPSAPVADIAACLAGGGIVIAGIWMNQKYPATAAALQSGLKIVRVTECNEAQAKIISDMPGVDVLPNPKKYILWVAFLRVGG